MMPDIQPPNKDTFCGYCGKYYFIWQTINEDSLLAKQYPDLPQTYTHMCEDCFSIYTEGLEPVVLITCERCGEHKVPSEQNNFLCQHCFNQTHKKCNDCDEYYHSAHIYQVILEGDFDVTTLCKECFVKRKISKCYYCGSFFKYKNIKDRMCPNCTESLAECKVCSSIHPKTETKVAKNVVLVEGKDPENVECCPGCYGMGFYNCNSCGKRMHQSVFYANNHEICPECLLKDGVVARRRWDFRPVVYNEFGSSRYDLFFGIENEVCVFRSPGSSVYAGPSRVSLEMRSVLERFPPGVLYLKHDGSIGGTDNSHGACGFEVVIHPHSFPAIRKRDWSGLFSPSQKRDETCGMHVHLTKKAFTTFHLYKFLNFIYNNQDFITFIGERDYTNYCKANAPSRVKTDAKVKYFDKGSGDQYRRQAVNLNNSETVELRFFANVADVPTFLKNVEFCHALFKFTLTSSRQKAYSVEEFKQFVQTYSHLYENLNSFINTNSTEEYN